MEGPWLTILGQQGDVATIVLNGNNTITGMNATVGTDTYRVYGYAIHQYGYAKVVITSETGGTLTAIGGNSTATESVGFHAYELEIKPGATVTALGGNSAYSFGLEVEKSLTVGGTLYASGKTGNANHPSPTYYPNSCGILGYSSGEIAVNIQEGGVLEAGLHGEKARENT